MFIPASYSTTYPLIPSDTHDLPHMVWALWVGTAGDLTVTLEGDDAGTATLFKNVPIGLFPLRVKRIFVTGSSAGTVSSLVGLR